MTNRVLAFTVTVLLFSVGVESVRAQHEFTFTKTVDPTSGKADFNTIQGAINAIGFTSDKWTVFIYAGEYDEAVTLDAQDENIDLVGIDRDSVIINATGTDTHGIVITSGTETSRNNRIANLTIKTADGIGIKIVHGGTPVPKNIVIEGVTIEAAGTDNDGINAEDVEQLRVSNVSIQTADGHGVLLFKDAVAPTDIIIEGATILAAGTDKQGILGTDADTVRIFDCNITSADGTGVHARSVDGLSIRNCSIKGAGKGLLLSIAPFGTPTKNVEVLASEIRGHVGVYIEPASANMRFLACHIVGGDDLTGSGDPIGVYTDHNVSDEDVLFESCRIEAIAQDIVTPPNGVIAILTDNVTASYINCVIRATSFEEDQAMRVWGVRCAGATLTVIGGSIQTSQGKFDVDGTWIPFAKATEVFDLSANANSADHILISGTTFSKWFGRINAAGRPRSVTQRTIDADAKDVDGILLEEPLTGSEQPNVLPDFQPDVYRVLSVTGNALGMNQDVYIIGKDWADNDITDKIQLFNITTVEGVKPFKSVTKIILPVQTASGQKVKVGTTNKLGLYYPLSADSDVIQWTKKASADNSYTVQDLTGEHGLNVDEVYATVEPKDGITDDDSFEWVVLTSP